MSGSLAPIRLVVCGSVDDGKSTLIGRLLAMTGSIPIDHVEATRHTPRAGSTIPVGDIDYSLVTDGLIDERDQGITIDVAYRQLNLPSGQRVAIADAPGHEQYTRNMAVAASTADAALVVVDAERGVRTQTQRHLMICSLMNVGQVVVAVNKIDTVDGDETRFLEIVAAVEAHAHRCGFAQITVVPVSALRGDNVTQSSQRLTWFRGPTVLEALAAIEPRTHASGLLRLPVQSLVRAAGVRGVAGTITSGSMAVGDTVRVVGRSGRATVARFLVLETSPTNASAGEAVCIELDPELDVARGDLLVSADDRTTAADRYSAEVLWMSDTPLAHGRSYELVSGPRRMPATVTALRHRLDVETGEHVAARVLEINEVGRVELALDAPLALDPFETSRDTGGFLLVDRVSGETVAAGMTRFALRRSTTVTPQDYVVDRGARARLNGHRSRVVWLTGLSGAGKSTIANAVEQRLHAMGVRTVVLDGDNVRGGLTKDLGFTPEDRAENVRRVAEVARLMVEAGLVTLVALVSPFASDRRAARELFDEGDFLEVFVDTPLAICATRDAKGLYAMAADGELPNLTGVGQDYERPSKPELVVSGSADLGVAVDAVVSAVLSE